MIVWNDRHISSLLFLRCGNDGNAMIKPFFPKTLSKTISDLIHGIKIIHFLKFALSRCPPPFFTLCRRDHTKGMKSQKLASIRKSSGIYSVIIVSNLLEELFFKRQKLRVVFVREICATNCPCDKGGWFWHLFFSFQAMNYFPTSRADVLKNII